MDPMKQGRYFLKADSWIEWERKDHETDSKKGLPRALPQKPYPEDAKLVGLVAPENFTVGDTPLRKLISQRRSRRGYTEEPLSLEELSYLLWATQGVTEVIERPDGIQTLRTVPSGGSLASFETYLLINRVKGVPFGLYRYLPLEHKLLFIRAESNLPEEVVAGCRNQQFVGTAAAVFIWTTIPYRMEWRYSVVAHKVIALDAGHLCQNLYLASESIGAGTCAIGAYDQAKMDAVLGVDGDDEFTIYAAPVGKVEG
jgi:SagB-type dehydrogenase family enzyme